MELPKIFPQASLQACIRPGKLDGNQVTHCYLRLMDHEGNLQESLSFGPDEKGTPDKRPLNEVNCQTIKPLVSTKEWQTLKAHYKNQCASQPFEFRQNDCCSCARDALETLGESSPDFLTNSNK